MTVSPSSTWVRVSTRSRLMMLAAGVALFVLSLTIGFFLLPMDEFEDMAIVIFIVGVFLLILALITHPSKDFVVLEGDKLTFKHRLPIEFIDIISFNTDDYLTLEMRNEPALIINSVGLMRDAYRAFCRQFVTTLMAWQSANMSEQTGRPPIVRKHFYGSPFARILGLMILAVSAGLIWFALQLPQVPASVGLLFGSVMPIGLAMMLRKGPANADVAEEA